MNRILILALLCVFAAGSVVAKDTPKASKATAKVATTPTKHKKAKSKSVKGVRCEAMTTKGTQCTRSAKEGSKFCWQHQASTGTAKKATPAKKG